MSDEAVAQFCSIASCDPDVALQYLQANDGNLEAALELYFATGGVTAAGQTAAPPTDDGVRERIEGTTDQIIDEESQMYSEMVRESRRQAHARRPRTVFNQHRDTDPSEMSAHERRLARLFRPPFDIIEDVDLEEAREEASADKEKRGIMVNIQEPSEFACQRLNRDLWSDENVKKIVAKNFLFVQYDVDAPEGEDYKTLYPFTEYPHIAILDKWTGEQMRVWDGIVPDPEGFISDILEWLEHAPADPGADSPIADPHMESAETPETGGGDSLPQPTEDGGKLGSSSENSDPIAAIEPDDSPEPPPGSETTRIQLRFGDGKREVRRFLVSDPVDKVYAHVKFARPELMPSPSLTSERRDLASLLGCTIGEANLKNSTVMVEKT